MDRPARRIGTEQLEQAAPGPGSARPAQWLALPRRRLFLLSGLLLATVCDDREYCRALPTVQGAVERDDIARPVAV